MKLVEIEPSKIVRNQRNLRRRPMRPEKFARLKASIAHGRIINPLHVKEIGSDKYEVVHGDNRFLAAVELELSTVPCLVPEDQLEHSRLDEAQHIFEMLGENQDREGLALSEEADGIAQLTLMDWSEEDIAQFRGVPIASVKKSLAFHRLPKAAQFKADDGLMGLDDVLLLTELEGDPEALQAVLARKITSGSSLKHAIEDEKRRAVHRRKVQQLRAELEIAGAAIADKPDELKSAGAVEVSRLKHPDGSYVKAEQVWDRPGFASFIESPSHWTEPRAVTVCLNPEAAGLTRLFSLADEAAQREAEREARDAESAARRVALQAASAVRCDWLVKSFGSAAGCKKILLDAVREAVIDADGIDCEDDHPLITKIAGADVATAEKAKADRLNRLIVGRFVAAQEETLAALIDHEGYWPPTRVQRALRYSSWLQAGGYAVSDAETEFYQALAARAEAIADNDGSDESFDDDQPDTEDEDEEPIDDEEEAGDE